MSFRIYINGEYAFTLLHQPSAWAAEAIARLNYSVRITDTVAAYPERTNP